MRKSDDLGDRMKALEEAESGRRLMPLLPVLARLDGRSFHTFTKHAKRPFSETLHSKMVEVTKSLVTETSACVGYTQSDEIQLAWYGTPTFFEGRIQKMVSSLAAMASSKFNLLPHDPSDGLNWHMVPTFDCRVWAVPTPMEAVNAFVWRQQDATRNSVSSAAQNHFSHRFLQNLSCEEMQEKLFSERGVNWNDYPWQFKRGTFVQRARVKRAFTAEDLEELPPKHQARLNPDLIIERNVIREADLWLTKITNRVDALLHGEDPSYEVDAKLQ